MNGQPVPKGDATGGVIPYKNPTALIGYYLGVFSLIPIIGVLLGIPAFILGILGLKAKKAHPEVKGSVHAVVAILLGAISTILYGGLISLFLFTR